MFSGSSFQLIHQIVWYYLTKARFNYWRTIDDKFKLIFICERFKANHSTEFNRKNWKRGYYKFFHNLYLNSIITPSEALYLEKKSNHDCQKRDLVRKLFD